MLAAQSRGRRGGLALSALGEVQHRQMVRTNVDDWRKSGVQLAREAHQSENNQFAQQAAALTLITAGRSRRKAAVEAPKKVAKASKVLAALRATKAEELSAHLADKQFCKKCKALFEGEQCSEGHPSYLYTTDIPREVADAHVAEVRRIKRAEEAERAEIAREIASLQAAEKAAEERREAEAAARQAEEVSLHLHPEPEPEPLGVEPEPEGADHGGREEPGLFASGESGAPWWSNYLTGATPMAALVGRPRLGAKSDVVHMAGANRRHKTRSFLERQNRERLEALEAAELKKSMAFQEGELARMKHERVQARVGKRKQELQDERAAELARLNREAARLTEKREGLQFALLETENTSVPFAPPHPAYSGGGGATCSHRTVTIQPPCNHHTVY
jgi:hypothetical protein